MSKRNYGEDKERRVQNERHAGIVIKNSKILLIFRVKKGYEYYVFPGGHRQKGEKGEDTVIREIEEETAIKTMNPKLVFEFKNYSRDNYDFYYICEWEKRDKPRLNGEEAVRNCKENSFEPMWVDVSKIPALNILPKFAKEWLVLNIATIQS